MRSFTVNLFYTAIYFDFTVHLNFNTSRASHKLQICSQFIINNSLEYVKELAVVYFAIHYINRNKMYIELHLLPRNYQMKLTFTIIKLKKWVI